MFRLWQGLFLQKVKMQNNSGRNLQFGLKSRFMFSHFALIKPKVPNILNVAALYKNTRIETLKNPKIHAVFYRFSYVSLVTS